MKNYISLILMFLLISACSVLKTPDIVIVNAGTETNYQGVLRSKDGKSVITIKYKTGESLNWTEIVSAYSSIKTQPLMEKFFDLQSDIDGRLDDIDGRLKDKEEVPGKGENVPGKGEEIPEPEKGENVVTFSERFHHYTPYAEEMNKGDALGITACNGDTWDYCKFYKGDSFSKHPKPNDGERELWMFCGLKNFDGVLECGKGDKLYHFNVRSNQGIQWGTGC